MVVADGGGMSMVQYGCMTHAHLSIVDSTAVVNLVHVVFLAPVCCRYSGWDLRLCGMHSVSNSLLH